MGRVFKALFLVSFLGFIFGFQPSPAFPISGFDHSRHLTGADVFFTKWYVELHIKWSKTMQDRNKTQVITFPRLKNDICPCSALRALSSLYDFCSTTSLFQYKTSLGWSPITDS